MNWFIVFFSLINVSLCIYEDQIGKFDWRQTYVGKVKFAQFDTTSAAKKIIVATEENVLAALNLKTGQIVWRHVLENAASGKIQLLSIIPSSSPEHAVIVTGENPYLVRGYDLTSGILSFEWSLALNDNQNSQSSEWLVHNSKLIHILPIHHSHIQVTVYKIHNGHNSGQTSKMPATWINDKCIITGIYYTCVTEQQNMLSLNMVDGVPLITRPLSSLLPQRHLKITLRPLENSIAPGFILNNDKIIQIQDNDYKLLPISLLDNIASATIIDSASGQLVLQIYNDHQKGVVITAHNTESGKQLPEIASERGVRVPGATLVSAVCTTGTREQLACRLLVTGSDNGLHLMHQSGRALWTREEALANVVSVEFVDLPVSDLDAAIESEFDQKEGSIWAAFSRRLATQAAQLQSLLRGDRARDHRPLVRDYFDLHKVLVLVTRAGKIFGIDNLSGEIMWQHHVADLDADKVLIFTRRSARHPPLDAYVTVVGKQTVTGDGLIISLNPISGSFIGERVLRLDTKLLQCVLLHRADEEKLHALALLDADENVLVLPKSAEQLVEDMFIYVAYKKTATVQGYALKYDGKSAIAQKTWSLNLGGELSSGHRIVVALGKPPNEKVHSPGRVLGDRSVLYKYVNPNLVLFVTEGPDALHKDVVVATCVDAVSGAVVASQAHRRARALPLAVHSEHFLAYVYVNDKLRRTEIATMELYEGETRWLSAGAAFSSLGSSRTPDADRAAYILPAAPAAAACTNTERSLADKHVLLALTTGAIVELPWAYLEPRRPVIPTAEEREEGLIPYAPELPLPSEAVINYNLTLHRVRAIHTSPSGLESTSLVLATGLDLFYTRVAPSKTFDLLKDDFDYYLITIVLSALVIATYATKYFASRKMLKMAWK